MRRERKDDEGRRGEKGPKGEEGKGRKGKDRSRAGPGRAGRGAGQRAGLKEVTYNLRSSEQDVGYLWILRFTANKREGTKSDCRSSALLCSALLCSSAALGAGWAARCTEEQLTLGHKAVPTNTTRLGVKGKFGIWSSCIKTIFKTKNMLTFQLYTYCIPGERITQHITSLQFHFPFNARICAYSKCDECDLDFNSISSIA